jgi:hypothetical protein
VLHWLNTIIQVAAAFLEWLDYHVPNWYEISLRFSLSTPQVWIGKITSRTHSDHIHDLPTFTHRYWRKTEDYLCVLRIFGSRRLRLAKS